MSVPLGSTDQDEIIFKKKPDGVRRRNENATGDGEAGPWSPNWNEECFLVYLSTGMTVQLVLDVATLFYFHSAAYDILAARQAFFHNKPADFVYVTC